MSHYKCNSKQCDSEMESSLTDEEYYDEDVNIDNENDDNDENSDCGNEDMATGGDSDDNDEYESKLPSKRARFVSTSSCNSDEKTDKVKSSTEDTKPEYDWSKKASKMMVKMGHTPGKGLGKHGQGRLEPLTASDQKGKRGLGYCPDESLFEREVDPEIEGISLEVKPKWLPNIHPRTGKLTVNMLENWMVIGREKLSYEDEYHFSDKKILDGVFEAKEALNDIDDSVIKKSRTRANPFETIGHAIFLNRAAMKMADLDYSFDYMFTNPKDQNGEEVIGPNDLLYFADVCAGPGGFSEYVFFRKKWRAKGFGFTLRKTNDFKLEEFFAGPCETFEPHYGAATNGELGDGDIFKPENITEFSSFVMENTDGMGVHFMMADGGFPNDFKSYQEIYSKQLYLCQCLVALKIVRTNGNFVVKLFDIFTRFSVGLVYLMYRAFERISIHKPNTSRPANSERYLICQYKKSNCTEIADYLFKVNELLCERFSTKKDVIELVPLDILKEEEDFYEYILESNNKLGRRQIHHLTNVVRYSNEPDKCDSRQDKFREECLKLWQIPNEARTDPSKRDVDAVIRSLRLSNDDLKCLKEKPVEIKKTSLLKDPEFYKYWHWTVVESDKHCESLMMYLGLGRKNVYRNKDGRWSKFKDIPNFELPAGTLVYGEIVRENIVNPNNDLVQYRPTAFHIVDGWFLGSEVIHNENILYRKKCCELFAKSLTRSNMIYRVKEINTLMENPYQDLSLSLSKLVKLRTLKNRKVVYGYDLEKYRFIVPGGLLLFPQLNENWNLVKSTKFSMMYYFNSKNNQKFWQKNVLQSDGSKQNNFSKAELCKIFPDFRTSFSKRRIWWITEEDLKELAGKY